MYWFKRDAERPDHVIRKHRQSGQGCQICGEKVVGHGLCRTHYGRWRRYGDPEYVQRPTSNKCVECGTAITPRAAQRFCSESCRMIAWRRIGPDKMRRYQLKSQYALTPEDVEQMWESQGGVCKVCKRSVTGKSRHIDHDHQTGRIRGILCANCNMTLGLVHDDPEWLAGLLTYLRTALNEEEAPP